MARTSERLSHPPSMPRLWASYRVLVSVRSRVTVSASRKKPTIPRARAAVLPRAAALLARLDVLAVPSRSDGSPLVVCEAMAAGVPVVASQVGGLPDLVEDGGTGLVVPPGEPEHLARALVSLLLDPEAARRLGDRGRRLTDNRSHERLVDRMTQLYGSVARAPAG